MNRKGFVPILILLIVVVVIAVGGGTWLYKSKISTLSQSQQQTQQIPTVTAIPQNSSTPSQAQATTSSPAAAKVKKVSASPTSIKTTPSSPPAISATHSTTIVTPVQPVPLPVPPPPTLVNGKTLQQRLQEASDRLHTAGSGQQIRNDFPDIQLVYTDPANNTGFPSMILPFKYYYSQEADRTFSICNIDSTVFICTGKLNQLIAKEDITSGKCTATSVYLNDPRIGGSGQYY